MKKLLILITLFAFGCGSSSSTVGGASTTDTSGNSVTTEITTTSNNTDNSQGTIPDGEASLYKTLTFDAFPFPGSGYTTDTFIEDGISYEIFNGFKATAGSEDDFAEGAQGVRIQYTVEGFVFLQFNTKISNLSHITVKALRYGLPSSYRVADPKALISLQQSDTEDGTYTTCAEQTITAAIGEDGEKNPETLTFAVTDPSKDFYRLAAKLAPGETANSKNRFIFDTLSIYTFAQPE